MLSASFGFVFWCLASTKSRGSHLAACEDVSMAAGAKLALFLSALQFSASCGWLVWFVSLWLLSCQSCEAVHLFWCWDVLRINTLALMQPALSCPIQVFKTHNYCEAPFCKLASDSRKSPGALANGKVWRPSVMAANYFSVGPWSIAISSHPTSLSSCMLRSSNIVDMGPWGDPLLDPA